MLKVVNSHEFAMICGIVPWSWLSWRSSIFRLILVFVNKQCGSEPPNMLLDKSRIAMFVVQNIGIVPLNLFLLRLTTIVLLRFPKQPGSEPFNSLLDRSRTRRDAALQSVWGNSPVNLIKKDWIKLSFYDSILYSCSHDMDIKLNY